MIDELFDGLVVICESINLTDCEKVEAVKALIVMQKLLDKLED